MTILQLSMFVRLAKIKKRVRTFTRAEGGATALLFALSMPVWIGGLAFGMEVGSWYYLQQKMQSSADTVASSVAGRLGTVPPTEELEALTAHFLQANQFYGTSKVSLSTSPGSVFGNGDTVTVTLKKSVKRYLTAFFEPGDFELEAVASAQVTMATQGCVLGLAHISPMGPAWSVVNVGWPPTNANIEVNGCEVLSNGSSRIWPGSQLESDCVRSRTGTAVDGSLSVTCRRSNVERGDGITQDPYVDMPDLDLSVYQNCSTTNQTVTVDTNGQLSNDSFIRHYTAANGRTYIRLCDGSKLILKAKPANPSTIIGFPNYLFIFDKSELIIEDNPTLRVGSNSVTSLYFVNEGRPVINAPNVQVTLRGLAFYSGMLFRGAKTNTLSAGASNQIIVGPGSNLQGGIYFPSSRLEIQAGNSDCLQIIAESLVLQGSWQLNGPCSLSGLLRPIVASWAVRLTQ